MAALRDDQSYLETYAQDYEFSDTESTDSDKPSRPASSANIASFGGSMIGGESSSSSSGYNHNQLYNTRSVVPNVPLTQEQKEALQKKWDSYPRIEQPAELMISLFPHQLVTVYNMEELERVRRVKRHDNSFFVCDFGILGDIPGYGKSLSIVSLILRDKMPWDITKTNTQSEIFTYNTCLKVVSKTDKKRVRANLLVVSSTLVEQWKEYFGFVKPGLLKIKEISHSSDLDDCDANAYDVIICSSIRYNQLIAKVGYHMVWKRFIFDEAGSTHIAGMRCVYAGFVWFVTATYDQLMRCSGNSSHYMKNFFSHIDYDMLRYFVIRNDIDFVKHSFKMPEVHNIRHTCHNPRILNVLSNYIDSEALTMIGAGDIRGAIARIGGGTTSESNLFELVSKRQKEKLSQAKFSFEFWTNRANHKEMEVWDKKVKEIEKTISELEQKYKNILKEDCSICYSEITNPVLLPCCQNIFCGGCVIKWLETTKSCPMCRTAVTIKDTVYIHSGPEETVTKEKKPEETLLPKQKTVLKIIKNDLTKKYLIFSMYDESFSQIRRELIEEKMNYVEISGSKATRDAKLKRFKEGHVNIVFLNSRFNGAGINLEMATDIILYHEMPPSIEEQVIGRALRIGRKGDLNVHRLVFQQ